MKVKVNSLLKKTKDSIGLFFFFLLMGCTSAETLENYNRGMYQTNKAIDRYTLKPIATTYQAIMPDPVERNVDNFFNNIGEVSTLLNSMLQGKLHNAAVSSARLVWNSTLGLGGLFDVATVMNLTADKEDFGQTLRVWGVPTGSYVVLPVLGPSTITDSIGRIGDYFGSPWYHFDWADYRPRTAVTALNMINTRAQFLSAENLLETATTDEYNFVKSAYLQRRNALVRDGVGDGEVDKAFDALFDE